MLMRLVRMPLDEVHRLPPAERDNVMQLVSFIHI
jgi:hypothetical protein